MRVVMTLRNGDFVLCDLERDRGPLRVVRRTKTDATAVMDMRDLDRYFAACIREPENPAIVLSASD